MLTLECLEILESLRNGPRLFFEIRRYVDVLGLETRSSATAAAIEQLIAAGLVTEAECGRVQLREYGRTASGNGQAECP